MSRLSRFKKAPAVKLPKRLEKGRFDDDSDDDDFKQPIVRLEIKPKTRLTEKVENANSSQAKQSEVVSSADSGSFSEYFSPPVEEVENLNVKTKVSQAPARPTKEKCETSKKSTSSSKSGKVPSKSQDEEEAAATPPQKDDNIEEHLNTVFCPFCWKKLADKLTGTTHIKSCAKDLPIEQIHEAMLLQEKQIQEWKQLGLNFPAFTENKKSKKPNPQQPKGRGGRGKKKNEDGGGVDPQLELAMALSVSLHEELEGRKQHENKFLIENGLDQEIGLAKMSNSPTPSSSSAGNSEKSSKPRSSELMPMPSTSTTSRRRRKKVELETLPLYTTSDSQKKAIIAERVSNILEKSMNEEKEDFYIRDALPAEVVGIPKRLQAFHNQECTLWNSAKSPLETKDETFSVLELDTSRHIEALERPDAQPSGSNSNEMEFDSAKNDIPNAKTSGNRLKNEVVNSVGEYNEDSEVAAKPKSHGSSKTADETQRSNAITRKNVSSHRPDRSSTSRSNFNRAALKHLPPVVYDVARMLFDGVDCDMTIYGREEKPIKCHRFMLSARCPKILEEVVVEEASGHRNRHIISLTGFRHETVKALVWYLYTGTVDSKTESLLADLQELGSTYGITITVDDSRGEYNSREKGEEKPLACFIEAEMQTDATGTKDSCNMTDTDTNDFADRRISINKNPSTDHDATMSQELFTTFCFEDALNTEQQIENASPSIPTVEDREDNNSTHSSVDLFEDLENDVQISREDPIASAVELEISDCGGVIIEDNLESPAAKDHIYEDDDYFMELNSPVPINKSQTSCEKKRSRSVSPLLDASMYSATQVANILQSHQDGDDGVKNANAVRKASKKLKLDSSIFDKSIETGFEIDDVENIFSASEDDECVVTVLDKYDNGKSAKSTFDNKTSFQSTITPKAKNKSRLSRRSISTPNLTPITNAHYSPLYNPQDQVNCNEEYDPLEDACDDSMFANIPDDVFLCANTNPKTPVNIIETASQNKVKKKKAVPPSCLMSSTPPSRSSQSHAFPQDDHSSQFSNDDSIPVNKKGSKKTTKGKEKPKAKLKLPKHLPSVQERVSSTQPSSSSTPTITENRTTNSRNKNSNATPMLNYSLIDTPILKQELKKYGIKPLPRSKAKVLLRHIYKETHK